MRLVRWKGRGWSCARWCLGLDLRFETNSEVEFWTSRELVTLRFLVWGPLLPLISIAVDGHYNWYTGRQYFEKNIGYGIPADMESHVFIFRSALFFIYLACMLYASLRMFGRWPSKLQYKNDLQDVVMAVTTMAVLHLYMKRTYNFHGNVIGGWRAKRELARYDFELEETNMLLCVVLLMNALCFYAPAGIDVLFVIVFVATVGYACLSYVFNTPEQLAPTRGSILFMLGGFALLGAYSREKHARSDWMSKAKVVRQERIIEDQLVHIEESEFGGFPSVCPRCGEVLSMISQAATPAVPQAASASSAVSDTSSESSEKSILSNTIGSSGSSGATGESVIEKPEVEIFAQTLIVHRANSSFWNQFGSAWEANQYSVGFSDNWFSEVNANAVESTLCRDRHGRDCGLFFNSISKSYELIFIPDLADFPLVLCHDLIEFEHMFPVQESEKFKRFVQKHIAQMTP